MSVLASHVVYGALASTVASNCQRVASYQERQLMLLPQSGDIVVYDPAGESLVIFDTAALVTLALSEVVTRPVRSTNVRPVLLQPVPVTDPDAYMAGRVIDPPSHL